MNELSSKETPASEIRSWWKDRPEGYLSKKEMNVCWEWPVGIGRVLVARSTSQEASEDTREWGASHLRSAWRRPRNPTSGGLSEENARSISERSARPGSLRPRPQLSSYGSDLSVRRWREGRGRCGLYAQWNVIQPRERRESSDSCQHGWSSKELD